MKLKHVVVCISLGCMAVVAGLALAGEAPHKLVIQISTDDPRTQAIALNDAGDLQQALGKENVDIEIVAYGPGLGMLTVNYPDAKRVQSLVARNISFSACGNTMKKIAVKTGREPKLIDGVGVVEAGVKRIMELQEQGYSYLRP